MGWSFTRRPWWLPVAAAVALALSLARAGGADARPFDDIVESGVINIAVYRAFAPFAEENGGDPEGIDIDLGRAIAREIGVEPNFMFFTADETVDDDLRNAVWKGHLIHRYVADLMLHVPYDRQLDLRNELAALYAPYFRDRIVVAHDASIAGRAAPLMALRGEAIGAELDSLSDFLLMSAYGGVLRQDVVHFATTTEAATALREGELGAVVGRASQIEAALGDRLAEFALGPVDLPTMARPAWIVGIAVREDSRDVGYAVEDIFARLVQSGEMQRIFAEHGVTWRSPMGE